MFRAQSLALYKNKPVIVADVRDRIEIRLEDGSSLKVRDKDLVLLHEGPVKDLPLPASGGDFDTARKMLASEKSVAWAEMAELVFGSAGPAEALACWQEAVRGLLFKMEDGLPLPLSDDSVAKEAQKRNRKELETSERSAFLDRVKRIKAERRKMSQSSPVGETTAGATAPETALAPPTTFEEPDGRFLSEIEALAFGKSSKSKTCADLGLSETPEAAQALLISLGQWDETVNPHPYRAQCPLSAPKIEVAQDLGDLPRLDLGAMTAWAIDNAWSKDPDDAIGWDGTSVWVHVADPASAILPDSAADIEALARGSTLYLPELTSPMLPDEALARFGLGLSVSPGPGLYPSSLALSFRIELADDASVSAVEAMPAKVCVRRCSYGEADALMEAGQAADLEALAAVAARRKARRIANGAVEIDIPEVRILVSGEGKARDISIQAVPRDASSGIVREMMLLAGEAAARWAFERRLAFPYYGQEAPAEMGNGHAGENGGNEDEAPSDGRKRPASLALQFARRRLMRSGMWGPSPTAHRGLGLPFYAQVTSPLRRYQDLLGHMQIRALLAGRPVLDADELSRRCALAQAASAATRQAERSSMLHWTVAYLTRHPQWAGDAVIVGQSAGGWQAYLPELGLETRLRPGEGKASHSGDRGAPLDEVVKVRLVRADVAALEAAFEEAH